jgi:ribosomal protein S18 acetylase RimI-like enzyme
MKNESGFIIREIRKEELPLLKDFLYEVIFQSEGQPLIPRSVIEKPELSVYIDGFGKAHDDCLVAEMDGKVVGAVWIRILAGKIKGYGNIDAETPEFAISILKEYRKKGIGTALMQAMIDRMKTKGYSKASLSVQKDNYAFELYKKLGFEIVEEQNEDYLMVLKLNECRN